MYQSKLFHVLKSFSAQDWKDAKKFILIDFDANSDPGRLFSYIHRYKLNLTSKSLSIEKVETKLFPGKTRKAIQNVMSKLLTSLQDYLRWHWLKSKQQEFELALLEAYNDRAIYHLFDQHSSYLTELINEEERNIWQPYHRLKHHHFLMFSDNPSRKGIKKEYIAMSVSNIEEVAATHLLFILTVLYYYQIFLGKDYANEIDYIEDKIPSYSNNLLINLLLETKNLISGKSSTRSFDKIFNSIEQNHDIIDHNIMSFILESLIRYSINEFKKGNQSMSNKMFLLYEFGINSKILLKNNQLSPIRFSNIVAILSATKKRRMAKQFITTNESFLPKNMRFETKIISLAQIYFDSSEYEKTIALLSTETFIEFQFSMKVRWLLLCSHFKLNHQNGNYMKNIIRNYFAFFNRNKKKISPANYKGSINLGRLINILVKSPDKNTLEVFLRRPENIIYRTWLEKLEF